MTTTLIYARPPHERTSRLVPGLTRLTLIYPLFTLGALYGEWILAWLVLGHRPGTWMDDPKDVMAGATHLFTALVFLGVLPAALAGAVLNIIWVIDSRASAVMGFLRLLLFSAFWPALFFVLWWDPLNVGRWWID